MTDFEPDDLYNLRSRFYLGHFDQVETEAASLTHISGHLSTARDCFVQRAHIVTGNARRVFSQVDASSATALQAVKLLATYTEANDEQAKELVISQLEEFVASLADVVGEGAARSLRVIAAQIYVQDGKLKEALQLLYRASSIEELLWLTDIHLRNNRVDLAAKSVERMNHADDDHPLTLLAGAWLGIQQANQGQGQEKAQEAQSLLQELQERFGASPILSDLLGVCQLHSADWSGAFGAFKESRELSMQNGWPVQASTLVNSLVALQQLGKPPQIIQKVEGELRRTCPEHPYLSGKTSQEAEFERCLKAF